MPSEPKIKSPESTINFVSDLSKTVRSAYMMLGELKSEEKVAIFQIDWQKAYKTYFL